ncbi:unnamed protein product [Phytophthora lilii]|uniref:Unnamed protein product n=1 Tax=Phytophthora lilii TaxID=2077276 RepID=A0A9W6TRS6_9STRA|nr:unnamed protein product [Phytophthora lilii]
MQVRTPSVVRGQLEDASVEKSSTMENDMESSGRERTRVSVGDDNCAHRGDTVVEKMFTLCVVDEAGVQTKYITRKKLRKFLRIKTKIIDEPDFMLILSNETIKAVARSIQRRDQPDNVGSAKAQRYMETDWDSFRDNPAFELLLEYKDSVFRPELPERLPEKRDIEHRIDVKNFNLAMFRQQWRQSQKQQHEVVRWVEDMVRKKLICPSISPHVQHSASGNLLDYACRPSKTRVRRP